MVQALRTTVSSKAATSTDLSYHLVNVIAEALQPPQTTDSVDIQSRSRSSGSSLDTRWIRQSWQPQLLQLTAQSAIIRSPPVFDHWHRDR
jgi:hypothetical protein